MYARELERKARRDWMRDFAAAIARCLDNLAFANLGRANSAQMKLMEVRAWTR
jgi:hypothetical protein